MATDAGASPASRLEVAAAPLPGAAAPGLAAGSALCQAAGHPGTASEPQLCGSAPSETSEISGFVDNARGSGPSRAQFEACAEEVREILARYKTEGKIVQASDDLEDMLRKMGLLFDMQIAPQQVGFDPCNRHGLGGNSHAVHTLLELIANSGWSWAACSHALCAQALPNDNTVEEFNKEICFGTDLPSVETGTIRFGSLAAGHTNMGLRAIAARMPGTDPRLTENGHYSIEAVRRHDKKFADAVEKGLRWRVLHSRVRVLFPEVLNILQAADNTTQAIARQEDEVSGLYQLWEMASRAQKMGEEPDWADIKQQVLATNPPYGSYLDSLILFVSQRAGGEDGEDLKNLMNAWRILVNPKLRSSLPRQVYEALAGCKFPLLALGLWEAAYCCPKEDVKNGVCMWLRASEVTSLARLQGQDLERVQLAERTLVGMRRAFEAPGWPQPWRRNNKFHERVAKFEYKLAQWVLKRIPGEKKLASSLGSIGQKFIARLAEIFPAQDMSALTALFPEEKAQPQSQTVISADKANAITLTARSSTGELLGARARLREQGLEVGMTVQSRAMVVGKIVAAPDEQDVVVLETTLASGPGGAVMKKTFKTADFLAQGWRQAPAAASHEKHPAWPVGRFAVSKAAAEATAKNFVVTALDTLGKHVDELCEPAGKLTIWSKPKKVEALVDLPVGSVVLAPETTKVEGLEVTKKAKAGADAWWVELEPPVQDMVFHLQANSSSVVCAPFWYLQFTSDDRKANMEVAKYLVSVYVGQDFIGNTVSPLPPAAAPVAVEAPAPTAEEKDEDEPTEDKANMKTVRVRMTSKGPMQVVEKPASGLATATGAAAASSLEEAPLAASPAAASGHATPPAAEAASSSEEEDSTSRMREILVTVPVLINNRVIPAGGELLVYRAQQEKIQKEVAPITIGKLGGQLAKKPRKA